MCIYMQYSNLNIVLEDRQTYTNMERCDIHCIREGEIVDYS